MKTPLVVCVVLALAGPPSAFAQSPSQAGPASFEVIVIDGAEMPQPD